MGNAQIKVVTGKITDAQSGTPLTGVSIWVEGTTVGTISTIDGQYQLKLNESKDHEDILVFRYLGYETRKIAIAQTKQKEVFLSVAMHPQQSIQLEAVTVTSSFRQATLEALTAERKHSLVIIDGISAEGIQKSPDSHAGQVLKRISGTSVTDQQFVIIRGIGERYNENLMNGVPLPSTESDKKAFAYDLIPTDFVDQVLIYKTATSDLPGDFAGGAVNIKTREVVPEKMIKLSMGTGYKSHTTFHTFVVGSPYQLGDYLGFSTIPDLPRAYKQTANIYTNLPYEQKLNITQQFPNTFMQYHQMNAFPPVLMRFSAANGHALGSGRQLGYLISIFYRNNLNIVPGTRNEFQFGGEPIYQYLTNNSQLSNKLGGIFSLSYVTSRNQIVLQSFFHNLLDKIWITREGINTSSNDTLWVNGKSNEANQEGLYMFMISGKHRINKQNSEKLNWQLSYARTYEINPDHQIYTLLSNDNKEYYISLPGENSPNPTELGRIYLRLYENFFNEKIDLERYIGLSSARESLFKAGLLASQRFRDFKVNALGYVDGKGYGKRIDINEKDQASDIFSRDGLQQNNIILAKLDLSSTDYVASEKLFAGYVMFEMPLANSLKGIAGVRVENDDQQLSSPGKTRQLHHNTDILPSLHFIYSLSEQWQLRASYFRSVNRPAFREIADYNYYDYSNGFITRGNPNLKRSIIDNIDLRIENYGQQSQWLNFSFFFKHFISPIEQINLGNGVLGYNNAKQSWNLGTEIEFRHSLDLFSLPWLKQVMLYSNISLMKGEVMLFDDNDPKPLQGESPYLFNIGISYIPIYNGWSFTTQFNLTGPRLIFRAESGGDAMNIFEKANHAFDVQISKNFKQHIELKFNASNLFHASRVYYYENNNTGNNQVILRQDNRSAYTCTFSYSFN